jgi:hypothetical protein
MTPYFLSGSAAGCRRGSARGSRGRFFVDRARSRRARQTSAFRDAPRHRPGSARPGARNCRRDRRQALIFGGFVRRLTPRSSSVKEMSSPDEYFFARLTAADLAALLHFGQHLAAAALGLDADLDRVDLDLAVFDAAAVFLDRGGLVDPVGDLVDRLGLGDRLAGGVVFEDSDRRRVSARSRTGR